MVIKVMLSGTDFRIKKTSAIQEQVSLSHTYSSQSTQHPNTTSQGTSPSVTQPLNNTMDNININIIAKYWVNILINQSRIIKAFKYSEGQD